MNKSAYIGVLILVVVIGGVILFKSSSTTPAEVENNVPVNSNQSEIVIEPSVKEFTIDAANFAFSLKTMTVSKGDTVKITLNNTEGMHDLRIDEFNIATEVLQLGKSQMIEFVASQSGTFEFYCSVGNHRAMGMKGTLTVK